MNILPLSTLTNLTSQVQQQITVPGSIRGSWQQLRLTNQSGVALNVFCGGVVKNLAPGFIDTFQLNGANWARVTPLATDLVGQVVVEVSDAPFDGTYPAQIAPRAIAAQGSVSVNPSSALTAGAASGQPTITVQDTSIFTPGQVVNINSITGGAGFIGFVKTISKANSTVTFTGNLTAGFNVGDVAIVVGIVGIFGQPVFAATAAGGFAGNLGLPQLPIAISNTMAAGATVVLVSGVAGQIVYVLGGTVGFDAISTGVNFEDTAGNSRYNFPDTAVDHPLDLKGAPIGASGTGARLHNTSGSSVNARGTLVYAQV